MLYFERELRPIRATERVRCSSCHDHIATWSAPVREDLKAYGSLPEEPKQDRFCAWCVMYDMVRSEWGYQNRDELLHVGRTCVGMAAQHGKPIPPLDEHGRLNHDDAEKYLIGVAFTGRLLRGPLGTIANAGS